MEGEGEFERGQRDWVWKVAILLEYVTESIV